MKFTNLSLYFLCISLISSGLNASIPEGSFTSLHVKAKDVDAYINFMKENTEAFKIIDSDVAGVCVVKTGNEYPGEMFVWNAFPSVEKAFMTSELYDPMKPSEEFNKLRTVLYSVTWKPLKEFELNPGYERLWRIETSDSQGFAKEMIKLEKALQKAGHNMRIGVFDPMGGGVEVTHLRVVTNTAAESGKVVDEYFAGASYGKIWDQAFAKYVTRVVRETTEFCETIYTK
tara:strand:+ start:1960 stop:2649 length:690 start_codon:yes stop_codon:yes gene_type:complete